MRLLTLPITVARVPAEFGLEAAKRVLGTGAGIARYAYEAVTGAGGAAVEEKPRAKTAPRRKPTRSANGKPRRTTATKQPARGTGSRAPAAKPSAQAARSAAPAAKPSAPTAEEPAARRGKPAGPATEPAPAGEEPAAPSAEPAGPATEPAPAAEDRPLAADRSARAPEPPAPSAAEQPAATAQPPSPVGEPQAPAADQPTPAPPVVPSPVADVDPHPPHIDQEAELVAEVAEHGAEEGAGPEVSLDEPWPGYDSMTAVVICDRLTAEDETVAAAVRLYEAAGKGRRSILEAASQNLSGRPSG